MVTRYQLGFTYLAVLFIVATITAGLAFIGEMWETAAKREKEAELLFIGDQYRRAIGRYYESTPGAVKHYPRTLDELLKDARQPSTQRYLRRRYVDPFGDTEWGLVRGSDGGVAGVYSLSDERPLKSRNLKLRNAGLEGGQRYADWKFVYAPIDGGLTK